MNLFRDRIYLCKKIFRRLIAKKKPISIKDLCRDKCITQQWMSRHINGRDGMVKIGRARYTKYQYYEPEIPKGITINSNSITYDFTGNNDMLQLEQDAWDFLRNEYATLPIPILSVSGKTITIQFNFQIKTIVPYNGNFSEAALLAYFHELDKKEIDVAFLLSQMYMATSTNLFQGKLYFAIDNKLRLHAIPIGFKITSHLNNAILYGNLPEKTLNLARHFWKSVNAKKYSKGPVQQIQGLL